MQVGEGSCAKFTLLLLLWGSIEATSTRCLNSVETSIFSSKVQVPAFSDRVKSYSLPLGSIRCVWFDNCCHTCSRSHSSCGSCGNCGSRSTYTMAVGQVFISFGEAGLLLRSEMAILPRVEHADDAMIWALMALFESIGASVGLSISGAIWAGTLPE